MGLARRSVFRFSKTRYYIGNYEEEHVNGNVRKIHYLCGAILIQNNGVDSLLYTYTDNQGSLIALTNENGNVVERYAYDPWGARRNPDNWTLAATPPSGGWGALIVNRGYTGHEHLDAFGIINMNGRVYDPLTAMFFSPDPYVQAPDNWLNYNRYGYCLNNPFKYTDPSGDVIFTLICIFVPGMQGFLPYAIAADIAWMTEYAAQVANNIALAQQEGYNKKDIFFGKIDFFDLIIAAGSGGVSVIPGFAWVTYATPAITNAVDIKGDGEVSTVFGGNNEGKKIGFGKYLGNALLETGAVAATNVFKNTLGKNSTKDIVNDIPKNTLKNMPKKELWAMSSKQLFGNFKYDAIGAFAGKLSQDGFNMQYDEIIKNQNLPSPYNPEAPNPFIPSNKKNNNGDELNRINYDASIYNLSSTIR